MQVPAIAKGEFVQVIGPERQRLELLKALTHTVTVRASTVDYSPASEGCSNLGV